MLHLLRPRWKEWLKRYLPAELLSSAATVLSGLLYYNATGDRLGTALLAAWAGNIAYFGIILLSDVLRTNRSLLRRGRSYTFRSFNKNIRALVMEFGLAEVLDSFIIRPYLMYELPLHTGNTALGLLLAKLAADVTFYLPAILFYERSKCSFRETD